MPYMYDDFSLADQFTAPPLTLLTVVLVTIGMYFAFLLFSRTLGLRGLTQLSPFDFAALLAMGAIIGRTSLLEIPTFTIGVTALATLFGLRWFLARLVRNDAFDQWLNGRPILLVRDGTISVDGMRRAALHIHDLRLAFRRAGVSSMAEVGLAVRERDGSITVVRTSDEGVDDWIVQDLRPIPGAPT